MWGLKRKDKIKMDYKTYQETVVEAMRKLYTDVLSHLPSLLAAIIVLIVGWVVAVFLSKLVNKLLEMIKIDHLANQLGLQTLSDRVGRRLSLAALGGWIVKWFFFLSTFIAAADILDLQGVSSFLYTDVLTYAGHVVVAMAVLLLGILAANFLGGIVSAAVNASGLHKGSVLGAMTKWVIVAFTTLTVLGKLGVGEYLQDLYRAVIAMLAIAGGLAFGLGGRDHASKILDKIEQNLKS